MSAHARLSPSACDRWSTCTASVKLLDDLRDKDVIPARSSTIYAAEGTVAHEVREDCLNFGYEPHDFIGEWREADGFKFQVTEEMAEFLTPGIDWIREHTLTPDVEIRVDLSPWLPGQFGTMDGGWLSDDARTLYASDLKYGAGEPVSAEGNKQQKLYALGYWHYKGRPAVEKLVVNIDQPRAGGMKFDEVSLDDLLLFGSEMAEVYKEIMSGETRFAPSLKGCRWCEAKKAVPEKGYLGCAAYHQWNESFLQGSVNGTGVPQFPDPETLTPARRYHIVRHAKMVEKWLAELHSASLQAALAGEPDPGSKVVIGQRGNRYITDKELGAMVLREAMGAAAFKPPQMIPLTEIQTRLKPGKRKKGDAHAWAMIEALIDQPDGKPILVPETDPRPAVSGAVYEFDDDDEFDDEL